MQRLFLMFPTGAAGAALLILRFVVATTFVVDGAAHWPLVTSLWVFLGFAIPAIFLCLGLFTPYCCVISGLVDLGVLLFTTGNDQFRLIIDMVDAGILGALGPGAYSVDSRIFGRRLLVVRPRP